MRLGWVCVIVVAVAGCGSVSHGSPTHSRSSTARAAIAVRVLANNEMPGFVGRFNAIDNGAQSWLADHAVPAGQQPAARAALQRLGFIRGVHEQLLNQAGDWAASDVAQFRSAASAGAEVARQAAGFRTRFGTSAYLRFGVPGIPGATGAGEVRPGIGAIYIAFAVGPYYYLVGRDVPGQSSIRSSVSGLVKAAQHLYGRVAHLSE